MSKSRPSLPIYPSIKNCAADTGIPYAVLRWAKSNGCPAFGANNSVKLGGFLAWYFDATRKTEDLPEGVASWRDYLNKVQSQREKIRLDIDRGKVIDWDTAHQQVCEGVSTLFGGLDRILQELPAAAKGMDELGIHSELDSRIKILKQDARQKFDQVAREK